MCRNEFLHISLARRCFTHISAVGLSKQLCFSFSETPRLQTLTAHGVSLEFTGELKRWPILSMVCDKEGLILLHRLGQFLKIGLGEMSGQKICPALWMHSILHHSLVVIR